MRVKDIVIEDFINYKKPSMFIITSQCDFKCCKEAGNNICLNMSIVKQPTLEIDNKKLVEMYTSNPITEAVVIAGLEPLDTFEDTLEFIVEFRKASDDDIVIYTGYYSNEVTDKIERLLNYNNIIVKFGRYIPNRQPHLDTILGIELANDEQYAVKLC